MTPVVRLPGFTGNKRSQGQTVPCTSPDHETRGCDGRRQLQVQSGLSPGQQRRETVSCHRKIPIIMTKCHALIPNAAVNWRYSEVNSRIPAVRDSLNRSRRHGSRKSGQVIAIQG